MAGLAVHPEALEDQPPVVRTRTLERDQNYWRRAARRAADLSTAQSTLLAPLWEQLEGEGGMNESSQHTANLIYTNIY